MIDADVVTAAGVHYARFGVHNIRLRFRLWRRSRPFWAAVLSLIGGLPMWYFPSKGAGFIFVTRTPIWAGILVGVLVELFAIFLLVEPQLRGFFGTLIVLFSLVSFFTSDFGGYFVGLLFGILGGSLGVAWTPVQGRTRRQQKWLSKSRGERRKAIAVAAVSDAPRVLTLDEATIDVRDLESVPLTEAEASTAPGISIIDDAPWAIDVTEADADEAEEIEITGWELPTEQPAASASEAIDLTDEVPHDVNVTDAATEQRIDITDEAAQPTIDLREEKATTAPPSSTDDEQPRADGPER